MKPRWGAALNSCHIYYILLIKVKETYRGLQVLFIPSRFWMLLVTLRLDSALIFKQAFHFFILLAWVSDAVLDASGSSFLPACFPALSPAKAFELIQILEFLI